MLLVALAQLFQSSPVPKDGRYGAAYGVMSGFIGGFNPRPSRRTGATGEEGPTTCTRDLFQSSPVPKDGRYRPRCRVLGPDGFQSSPVPKDGRYLVFAFIGHSNKFQSSPVPKDGRYGGARLG